MRNKVGTTESAQHARQAQSGCSPALEEHPGEQVDHFLSQGSTVQTGSGPYGAKTGLAVRQHVTPAGGLGHGGGRWLWRLRATASPGELSENGANAIHTRLRYSTLALGRRMLSWRESPDDR